tara:strand:- start:1 stop:522 length:522 start_codon:yes stop_codon:yes gene_type:complete
VGPIVITEVMASPSLEVPDGVEVDDLEYIELYNPTEAAVALSGWALSGGVEWTFSDGLILYPGATLLVLSWDSSQPSTAAWSASFREHYGLDEDAALAGGYSGSLSDQGEEVMLWRLTDSGEHVLEDGIAYGDAAWPSGVAPGEGEAWHRVEMSGLGLLGESWAQGEPSPQSP